MIGRKTCLLLGAGASEHLGFPLGLGLRHRILAALREAMARRNVVTNTLDEIGEDYRLLFDRLSYGHWASPDAFLERHPQFNRSGKYLICHVLSELEEAWSITSRGGWYENLISALHVENVNRLQENRLSIITFNYDRSVDFRLHKYVENQFDIPESDAWQILTNAIPIIHLHGTLGDYPECPYGDKSNLVARSEAIKIVSEVDGNQVAFENASSLLNDADRVIALGFGFGVDNVERLRFFKRQEHEGREVVVTGALSGGIRQQKEYEWLSQWGLHRNTHVHARTANDLFSYLELLS